MKKKHFKSHFKSILALLLVAFLFLQNLGQVPIQAAGKYADVTGIKVSVIPPGSGDQLVVNTIDTTPVVTLDQPISQKSQLKLRYEFTAPSDLSGNDPLPTLELPLPKEFLAEKFGQAVFPDESVNKFFTYKYDFSNPNAKKIIVTFDKAKLQENGSAGAGAKCYIEAASNFNLDQNDVQNEKNITVDVPPTINNKAFKVRFLTNTDNVPNNLSKTGKFYSTQDPTRFDNVTDNVYINPHEVKWTVDINKQLKHVALANTTVVDTFDKTKLKYQDDSLKITELNVALNGTATPSATVLTSPSDYTLTSVDGRLTINFVDGGKAVQNGIMNKAYRLEYITDIEPTLIGKKLNVSNSVSFGDVAEPVKVTLPIAAKIADGTSKSAVNMVRYSGKEQNDQIYYRWTVVANRSQRNLVSIEDTLPAELELINYGKNPFPKNGQTDESVLTDIYNAFLVRRLNPNYFVNTGEKEYTELTTDQVKALFTISFDNNSRKLTITPKQQPTHDAYSFIYDTKYTGTKQNSYQNKVSVSTTSGLKTINQPKTADTGELKSEMSKQLDKETNRDQAAYHIDYDKGIVRWRINVDPKFGSMENLRITDYSANKGLTLINPYGTYYYKDSAKNSIIPVEINDRPFAIFSDGEFIPRDQYDIHFTDTGLANNTATLPAGGEFAFQIAFKDTFKLTDPLTILYHTKIDRNNHRLANELNKVAYKTTQNDERDIYINHVKIDWGTNNTLDKKEAIFEAHPYVKDNGGKVFGTFSVTEDGKKVVKNINPLTREMEWVIYTNFNAEPNTISNITDTISAGHKLVRDSFKVYPYTLNSKTGVPDNVEVIKTKTAVDGVLTVTTQEDNRFEVSINNGNQRYALFYKTVLTDDATIEKYSNTAQLNGRKLDAELAFKVKPQDRFVAKSGAQKVVNGGTTEYIDWNLNINKSLSHLANVVVTDTLDEHQEYDLESFRLVHYPNTDTVVDPEDYILDFPTTITPGRGRSFKLSFKEPINTEYRLQYSTFVTRESAPFNPNNTVTIEGQNVEDAHKNQNVNVDFSAATTTAGSDLKLRKLTIEKKLQRGTNQTPLAGINFQLYKGDKLYRSFLATDDQGLASTKVPAGTYRLHEVVLDKNHNPYITLKDKEIVVPTTVDSMKVDVINYPRVDLQIEKVLKSDPNKKIADIQFELYTKDGNTKIHSFTKTNSVGKTDLARGLDVGTYIVKELPNSQYQPIADFEVEITEEMVAQMNETGNLTKEIIVANEVATPLLPYVPTPSEPTKEPEKDTSDKDKPNTETPDKDKPKDETPKDETPKDETPKDETPEGETPSTETPNTPTETPSEGTPNQPTPPTDTPTIDGEIDIPENSVPLMGREPNNGKVVLEGNKWKYTPNKGFYGKDNFTVIVRTPDGEETEEIIEVDVPIPLGHTTLPKTDGIPPFGFFLLGSLALIGAFQLKKRA